MFDAINTAGTGMQTYHTWLDVIANNVANVNDTASPSGQVFEQQYVQAGEINGAHGVHVTSITAGHGPGFLVYDPNDPLADAAGEVRHANVDLAKQMSEMIAAQRAFQANSTVVDRAKTVYEAAIAIGKGSDVAIVPISAIGAIGSITPSAATTASNATAAAGGDFAAVLNKGLDAVSAAQTNADNLIVQAATGQAVDPAALTIATTQATLMTQLATTVQSKAVAAFNTIMGMQA